MDPEIRRKNKSKTSFVRLETSCRICLEKSDSSNLISPCKCIGSMTYVHEDCLKTWVEGKSKGNLKEVKCEVCNEQFKMEWEEKNVCVFHHLLCRNFGKFIFVPVIVFFEMMLVLLMVKLSGQIKEASSKSRAMSIVLLIFSSAVFLVLLVLSIRLSKFLYIKRKIFNWSIFNYKKFENEEDLSLKIEEEEETHKRSRSRTVKK